MESTKREVYLKIIHDQRMHIKNENHMSKQKEVYFRKKCITKIFDLYKQAAKCKIVRS